MYRDPSEFRERFKAYKDGKSVREIYGLPGYEPGKLPVEEMMPYILAVENPTKQGLVNGVWRPPTDSTKWDVHAIGGGLDIREQHNPIVYNYLKTNGRLASPFLTAREEEVLREKVFKKTMLPALQNVYNKYGNKISSKGYARLAGMKWQGHPFLMAISPDSVTGKAFIKAIESGDKDLDSVFDAYYKYPANAKRYATRIQADANYWKNHNTVATKPVPQEPIIARQDATRVAATIPKEKTIPIADPRNATIAEALRAMWAHTAFENMPKISDMPIWESSSLPALTPVEYDVAPLKTYASGKVSNEPVITQGRAGSRLDKVDRMMDPDEDDDTKTRVAKRVGKGFTSLAKDAKEWLGLETIDRFATHTQRPSDYVDATLIAAGNIMISKILNSSAKAFIKQYVRSFDDMDARALGEYFFREHPELMTKPQEAWYGELAKKLNSYFLQAIHRRSRAFLKEGVTVNPESISSQLRPEIKIAHLGEKNKYGGIYSASDNTMLVNADRVKDPRTAMRVTGHEDTHAMQSLFEDATGRPYPTRYGAEMEGLFPFTAEQRAKRPGVHIGKEIDASLHEGKMMRYYDTDELGKALDKDFKNMSDEEYKEYMNNGYFKDIMLNILSDLDAQKKFVSKLKNGKLPGYYKGLIPWGLDDTKEKAELWANDWLFRLTPAAGSKVVLQWNATGSKPEPESAELYTLRRIKQTEWKKPSGRKMLEMAPAAVDFVPGAGDIKLGLEAASATTKGNYLEAGLLGAGLLIPNAVEKSIKLVLKNIDYRLRDNSGKVIDFYNLLRKKAAMAELTGDYSLGAFTKDIAKDKYYTMGIQKGKEYFDYPSIVLQILETSIKPRMSAMRPWMPEKEFDKEFYRNANGMWSMHPIDTWKAAYGDETTVTGLYTPGTGKISVRAGGGGDEVTNILLHEVRHKLDNGMPLTAEEESILRSAYGDRFLEVPKVSEDWDITGIGRDYDMWPEAVTTNRDARSLALGPMERRMNVHLQNIVIDKLSDQLILEAVANANGYGRRFVDNIIGDGPLDASLVPKEQIKAWREAMKKVGMFSGAAYLASNLVPEYAYGKLPGYSNGKIRIKPANRGKFNATKKRTGKTTEELTHSKNPLTRKRAIFALNARKWDHK